MSARPEGAVAAADAMAADEPAEDARSEHAADPRRCSGAACTRDDRVGRRPRLPAVLRERGERLEIEARIVRTDGEPRWIRIDGHVSASADGRPSSSVRPRPRHHRAQEAATRQRLPRGTGDPALPARRLRRHASAGGERGGAVSRRSLHHRVRASRRYAPSRRRLAPAAARRPATAPRAPERSGPGRAADREDRARAPDTRALEHRREGGARAERDRRAVAGAPGVQAVRLHRYPARDRTGRCFGVFAILTRRDGRRFAAQELELVERVGERVASALENARLYATLRQADERKAHFLATLSHELRNPLAAIMAGLDAVRDSIVAPAERATLGMIDRQAEGLMHLMDDLLDVARVDADKFELDLEWVVGDAIDRRRLGERRPERSRQAPAARVPPAGTRSRRTQPIACASNRFWSTCC